MGDRANFGFVQPNGQTIVLYGHWAGHQMLGRLADAVIAARPRWNDVAYGTRIAISHLIGNEWANETGWGLHVNEISDNEHKIAIVDGLQKGIFVPLIGWLLIALPEALWMLFEGANQQLKLFRL